MFDINNFIATISKDGVANASNFSVLITPPNLNTTMDMTEMTMRCDAVEFPGKNINVVDSNYSGMPHKVAMGATSPDIDIAIILSSNFKEKLLLQKWQDMIVGPYRNGQTASNMFNIKYYKDYVGHVAIMQYDDTGEVVYQCNLIDAYPQRIGNISASWDQGAVIQKLGVTFTYRYYTDSNGE